MLRLPFVFGIIRNIVIICQHPDHQRARARYDERLAALKRSGKLYEDKKHEQPAPSGLLSNQQLQSAYNNAAAQQSASGLYGFGYGQLGNVLGSASELQRGTGECWR